jgi:light-regulated signal transduction histidine kinase (bacteriophytochrome)
MAPAQSAGVALEDLLPPGEPIDLNNCAREPIHLPGAIQPHGLLLVVRLSDGLVVQASVNASEMLGGVVQAVVGSRLDELLGDAAPALLEPEGTGAQLGAVSVSGREYEFLTYPGEAGFCVVELEPVIADNAGDTGEPASAQDVLALLDQLWGAGDAQQLLDRATATVRALTGHDRVWAYRFEDDGHGVIVAEAKSDHIDSFLGLHFPEGDIPAQARALYLRTGIRTIVDAQAAPVAVMPVRNPDTGAWTDMSDGALRAVSGPDGGASFDLCRDRGGRAAVGTHIGPPLRASPPPGKAGQSPRRGRRQAARDADRGL